MSNTDDLLHEPTTTQVEDSKTVSWIYITLIKVGVFISLPGFATGAKIGSEIGLQASAVAFFFSGIILGTLGSLTGLVGAQSRFTTYMITQFSFGKKGALLINLIIALSLLGWFGINTSLFGRAVATSVGDASGSYGGFTLFAIVGGALMIASAIFGFKALSKLSQLAVPLLVIGMIVLVYQSLQLFGFENALEVSNETNMSLGKAISATVGGTIVGIVVFPDICRYSRKWYYGIIAAILTFAVAKPALLFGAALPSILTNEQDIILMLNSLGLGLYAFAVVVFATVTSNNGNLYGASLSLSTVFKGRKYWEFVVIAGVIGTCLAITGIMSIFIPFLQLLGITIPPVAGIYILQFFILKNGEFTEKNAEMVEDFDWIAIGAWASACIIGYLSLNDVILLTTIPGLDSLICAGILLLLGSKLLRKISERSVETTHSN